jgi:transposase
MRKQWEGLSSLIEHELGQSPISGALFLFTNKRRNRAKVLYFDGTGLCILQKRLERGRFAALWQHTDQAKLSLKKSELILFLEGSDLVGRFQVSPPILTDADLAIVDQT